jgi:putative transposase
LQQAVADCNAAYRNFFASLKGDRKGPRVGRPRFRTRKDRRQAIRFTANARFSVLGNGRLRLPKIGALDVRWSRPLPAAPSSVMVIRDSAGRYHASFVVEVTPSPLPETRRETGIDLGLGFFAVLDDGTRVTAPRFFRRVERKLRKAQRDLSRKQKAAGTGKGPERRSRGRTRGPRTRGGTSTTRHPRRSSARPKRCTWKTSR